jgi:uncharacterized protein (DUF433 family)
MPAELTENQRQELLTAMRHPRGRYSADRASQLSGVATSTVYDWQRNQIYVPDFGGASPMAWSYRDLVYLRLLAWLRQLKMPRPKAADWVAEVKQHVAEGNELRRIRATAESVVFDDETTDRKTGANLLPFDDFTGLLSVFDLLDPVEELGKDPLWGPDLVTPSTHTYISPWVLGGDPCVENTRIPTSTILALHEERGLSTAQIVELYPGLSTDAAEDAYELEKRLRGFEPERHAA